MTSDVVSPRSLGSTEAQLDVPASWLSRANGAGFSFEDEAGDVRLCVWAQPTRGGRFDRLPRTGAGMVVTERVLESGARYYRRADEEGVAIFVDLALGDGTSLLCASGPELEHLCVSLRRKP